MTEFLYGKPIADEIYADIKSRLELYKVHPTLMIIKDKIDDGVIAYEKAIINKCSELDISVCSFAASALPKSHYDFNNICKTLGINGIIALQPCDKQYVQLIPPMLDIDCATQENITSSFLDKYAMLPATSDAVLRILEYYQIPKEGQKITVINRSNTVGKPLAMRLLDLDTTVTICHSKTDSEILEDTIRNSDILITAIGKPHILNSNIFCYGCNNLTVIDIGTSCDDRGKLCGDVNAKMLEEWCYVKNVTPVKNGVGIVTTAVLLERVVSNAIRMKG